MKKMSLRNVYLWVVFGTFLSALGPSIFKKMLKETGMNQELSIVFFLFFGAISMLAVYVIDSPTNLKRKKIKFSKIEVYKLIGCGILVAMQFWAFTTGMNKGTVTETTLAVRISPFISVLFGSLFLNEKIKNRKNLTWAIICCLSGFLFMQNTESLRKLDVPSMIYGTVSAFALAGKNTISSSLVKKHHKVPSAVVVILGMFIGGFVMIFAVDKNAFMVPSVNQFLVLLFLGFGTIAVPAWINNHAFKETENMGAVTFFSFLLPFLGGVSAYFLNEESGFDYPRMIISLLIITFGIYLINKKGEKK